MTSTSPLPTSPERGRSERARRARRERIARRSLGNGTFASPLQYDESGFPINNRPPSFAERVRRLIAG
jgi:hypothetical protein